MCCALSKVLNKDAWTTQKLDKVIMEHVHQLRAPIQRFMCIHSHTVKPFQAGKDIKEIFKGNTMRNSYSRDQTQKKMFGFFTEKCVGFVAYTKKTCLIQIIHKKTCRISGIHEKTCLIQIIHKKTCRICGIHEKICLVRIIHKKRCRILDIHEKKHVWSRSYTKKTCRISGLHEKKHV